MERVEFYYNLVEISWNLEYELNQEAITIVSEEKASVALSPVSDWDDNEIPIGQTMDDIRKRQDIISHFFYQWKKDHPEKKVYNNSLKDFIHVRSISIEEAKEHAAKSMKSTKAILMLDEVLEKANKEGETPIKKGNKNQSKFEKMIIMSYQVESIGLIKLTVGIMRTNKNKVQYGISTLRDGQLIIEQKKVKRAKKKRKASRG